VGQPQSQEELNAWIAIEQAADMQQKAKLAEDFLRLYPESGLTPLAHQLLAVNYQIENNFEKFTYHGEKTLEELPNNPLILSALAVAYAQKGEPDKATDRAKRGLHALEGMAKPAGVGEADWVIHKDQLEADAHYALGVASVIRHQRAPAAEGQKDTNITEAIEELTAAVKLDPSHDRAYYHLGFAFARQNNAEKAMESYARAAGIGGIAQSLARTQLQKLYEFVYKSTDGMEQAINQQKEYVQRQLTEKRARAESLQSQSAPQQPAAPSTSDTPTPQP
jgi:tetratricopeptide (TPR) repeat protein